MLEQLFAYYYASFCIQLLKSRIHIQDSNPLAPGGPSPCAILATEAGRNRMTLGCQAPSLMNCLVLAHVAEMEWGIRLVIHAVKKTELHMDSNCSKMIGPEDYVIRAFCEPPSVPE